MDTALDPEPRFGGRDIRIRIGSATDAGSGLYRDGCFLLTVDGIHEQPHEIAVQEPAARELFERLSVWLGRRGA